MLKQAILAVAILALVQTQAQASELDMAQDYYRHGLHDKAKEVLIGVVYSNAKPDEKANAYRLLGEISYADDHYSTALSDWKRLLSLYPKSAAAAAVKTRIQILSQMAKKVEETELVDAVAKTYLKNGDFFVDPGKLIIDTSYLDKIELAVPWFDRVIAEFPGTSAAEMAYYKKIRVLLGWTEPGSGGKSYGAQDSARTYMPRVVAAFDEMKAKFPESTLLQPLRFQIAQTYWSHYDYTNAKTWFDSVIQETKGASTFYSEMTKSRYTKFGMFGVPLEKMTVE